MNEIDELIDLGLIKAIVEDRVTPEVLDIYSDICMIFDEVNFEGHFDELELLFNKLDCQNISYAESTIAVVEIMMVASEYCLKRVGVTIDPETPLRYIPDLLRYLLLFNADIEPDVIYAQLESSEESIEAVCQYMAFKTEHPFDVWLTYISDVNSNTIDVMLESLDLRIVANENATELEEYDTTRQKEDSSIYRTKEKLLELDPTLKSVDYTTESSDFATLFDSVYNQINGLEQDSLIKELVTIGVLSNESSEKAENSMREVLDDLYSSPSERLSGNNSLRIHLNKFKHLLGRHQSN